MSFISSSARGKPSNSGLKTYQIEKTTFFEVEGKASKWEVNGDGKRIRRFFDHNGIFWINDPFRRLTQDGSAGLSGLTRF